MARSRFDGDGRHTLTALPRHVTDGTRPKRIRRGTARLLIENFENVGLSTHSAQGSTLWVIREYCESKGRPFLCDAKMDGDRVVGYVAYIDDGIKAALGKPVPPCRAHGRQHPEGDCGHPRCDAKAARLPIARVDPARRAFELAALFPAQWPGCEISGEGALRLAPGGAGYLDPGVQAKWMAFKNGWDAGLREGQRARA